MKQSKNKKFSSFMPRWNLWVKIPKYTPQYRLMVVGRIFLTFLFSYRLLHSHPCSLFRVMGVESNNGSESEEWTFVLRLWAKWKSSGGMSVLSRFSVIATYKTSPIDGRYSLVSTPLWSIVDVEIPSKCLDGKKEGGGEAQQQRRLPFQPSSKMYSMPPLTLLVLLLYTYNKIS